jgi:aubergine-like protein
MAQVENKSKILLPENIIVYRDGIGAGDIQTVLDIELGGIKVFNYLIPTKNQPLK